MVARVLLESSDWLLAAAAAVYLFIGYFLTNFVILFGYVQVLHLTSLLFRMNGCYVRSYLAIVGMF